MHDPIPGQPYDQFPGGYDTERQRAHAARCLGWIARNAKAREFAWWTIPDLAPLSQARLGRRIVTWAVLAVDVAVMTAVISWAWSSVALVIYATALIGAGRRKRISAAVPCATVPRWPGWGGLVVLLVFTAGTIGLGFFPVLLSMWTVPAQERPTAESYRADRLNSVLYGLACAPAGAFLGILAFSPAYGSPGWLAGTLLFAVTLPVLIWTARRSRYSLLKLAELALTVQWRARVSFLRVLQEAEDQGILNHPDGTPYLVFSEAACRYFAGAGTPESPGQQAGGAARPRREGARLGLTWLLRRLASLTAAQRSRGARLLRRLLIRPEPVQVSPGPGTSAAPVGMSRSRAVRTKARVERITFDFAAGAAAAAFAGYLISAVPEGGGIPTIIVRAIAIPLLVFAAAVIAGQGLRWIADDPAPVEEAGTPSLSPKTRAGAAVVAVAVAAVLIAVAGTFLAGAFAFLLPPAFVTACGFWACSRAFRRWHASPRTWLRSVADYVAAVTIAAALVVAADRDLLTTQWATALLFPVAAAGSLRLRTAMKARGLLVRAGANIALSLLLGIEGVLFVVWLANVLGMPRAEVSMIRTGLSSAGSYAGAYDGGPLWATTYAALAAASVILARYPARLKRAARWFDRLRPGEAASAAQQAVTGLYIGLLTVVFIAAAGPAALTPTLDRQLKTTYTVALQRQLAMQAETSACDEIRAEASALKAPGAAATLAGLIQEIHRDAGQQAGTPGGTKAEDALAYQVGQDQAAALGLTSSPPPVPGSQPRAAPASPDPPATDAPGLSHLATQATTEEKTSDQAGSRLKAAFELTVVAVANAIPIPAISKNEVAQILVQYISGLIDDSAVTDALETQAEQRWTKLKKLLVIPDPGKLADIAEDNLDRTIAARGDSLFPPLPPTGTTIRQAVKAAEEEQEIRQTGDCTGCIDLGNPGGPGDDDDDGQHPDTHIGDP